jgi:hypothetical protein
VTESVATVIVKTSIIHEPESACPKLWLLSTLDLLPELDDFNKDPALVFPTSGFGTGSHLVIFPRQHCYRFIAIYCHLSR